MPIALTDEHEAQRLSARRWLDTHCPSSVPRALLDAEDEELQPVWKEMAAQGWLGIHLPEEYGGQGFGLFELAVLVEETGRSVVPGPLLPTVVTSALVAECADRTAAAALLPGLIDGSTTAAVSLGDTALDVVGRDSSGELVVTGSLRPLLGASTASVVLAPARHDDGTETWCLIDVPGPAGRVRVSPLASLDATRRLGTVQVDAVAVAPDRQLVLAHDVQVAPDRDGPDGRRARRRSPVVPRDRHRIRQGPGPVRSAHRPVPGGQAPTGRHGGAGGADDRGGLGCGHGRQHGVGRSGRGGAGHGHRRCPGLRRLRAVGAGVPAAAGRHRVHVGARPPPPPQAGPCRSAAGGGDRRVLPTGGRGGRARRTPGAHRRPARRGRTGPLGVGPPDGRAGRHAGGGPTGRPGRRGAGGAPLAPTLGPGRRRGGAGRHRRAPGRGRASPVPTSGSAPGPCRSSSPAGPRSSVGAGSGPRCWASWPGASCSPSPEPAPTWPACRPGPCGPREAGS